MAPLRAAVAAGDHRRADELARALQSDRWVQAFQPLGWIEWEHDRAQSGKTSAAYRRSLDMSAAVAVADAGTGVRLETFVSAFDDVLVARADGAPTAAPLLCSPHPVCTTSSTRSGVTWVTMSGRAPANVLPHYVPDDLPVVYAEDAPDEDGLVDAGMGFALVVAWVPDERGGRLVAAAESGFRGWRARPSADVVALAQVARARVEAAPGLTLQASGTPTSARPGAATSPPTSTPR